MSVSFLERDEWSEVVDHGSRMAHPSWEQVEKAILSLDGTVHTIVRFGFNEDSYMTVAGGSDGCYLVFVTTDGSSFSHLVDVSKSNEPVLLDIGGQPGEYPLKRCVSLDVARDAAKVYFECGRLKSDCTWETD